MKFFSSNKDNRKVLQVHEYMHCFEKMFTNYNLLQQISYNLNMEGSNINHGQSLFHLPASELYPKRTVQREHDKIITPFSTLYGESVQYLGPTTEGILVLSNYRLYLQLTERNIYYNVPLGLIEKVGIEGLINLRIICKQARTFHCGFDTNEQCLDWFRRITKAVILPKTKDGVFAFAYFAWASEELGREVYLKFGKYAYSLNELAFREEVDRLEFDVFGGSWRISSVNVEHKLCKTYPRYLLTPASVNDNILENASKFRTSQRFPAVVWRHRGNGAVIARCSQPEVGWFGWRSSEDEELLKAISDACAQSNPSDNSEKKLLILDARSYTTAVVNRARGGGCECSEYYHNCEIKFMNLANIHSVRKSFDALTTLCAMSPDQSNWYSALENTRWLHYISGLLSAAVTVTTAIEKETRPVLVHCSDGWDRTPQIVSLAQLLLDPFYRTINGFEVLIEREWLEFGHKFSDRGGFSEDINERSPIFLQWLDCIQNLLRQFPCAFEFSKIYLVKLALHTYSNLFGTFLCNSSSERFYLGVKEKTFSIWTFLQGEKFRNNLYNSSDDQVLWPKFHVRYLDLWRELYLDCNDKINQVSTPCFTYNSMKKTQNNDQDSISISSVNDIKDCNWETGNESINITGNGSLSNHEDKVMNDDSLMDNLQSLFNEKQSINDVSKDACKKNKLATSDSNDENNSDGLPLPSLTHTTVQHSSTLANGRVVKNSSAVTVSIADKSMFTTIQSIFPELDPLDGLEPFKDQIQTRLQQIVLKHQSELLALKRALSSTQRALFQQMYYQFNKSPVESKLDATTVDIEYSQDDNSSVCGSESSWVAVEEQVLNLWIPDNAIKNCMNCQREFWFGRRKHHCRKCGKIYCAHCSKYVIALPEIQLNKPVRVCESCYFITRENENAKS